ncbi:hypothetical protein N9N67_02990 [Bacteriovoracaceae bacterium]|nr:hypothetical protein [Bacteriovoracaceae bacterium]
MINTRIILLLLISIIFLSFSLYSQSEDYPSFGSHNVKKVIIDKVEFPRSGEYLYRGLKDKRYTPGFAIRAMMTESSNFNFNSPGTSLIIDFFKSSNENTDIRTWLDDERKFNLLRVALNKPSFLRHKDIITYLNDLKTKVDKKDLIEDKIFLANYFVKTYLEAFHEGEVFDYILDEQVLRDLDNPFVVYSALLFSMAKTFSNYVLGIKQTSKRSVDANILYLMKDASKTWRHFSADRSEFITPSHFKASEINSYYKLFDTIKISDWARNTSVKVKVDYGLFKIKHNNQSYVLIVNTRDDQIEPSVCYKDCIKLDQNDVPKYCNQINKDYNAQLALSTEMPRTLSERRAPVIGIINHCNKVSRYFWSENNCEVPQKLLMKYNLLKTSNSVDISSELKNSLIEISNEFNVFPKSLLVK